MTLHQDGRYQKILVPLDGSRTAEQVLSYVRVLAQHLQAPIELLRVIEPPPPELADFAHGDYPHRVEDSLASHARDYLETLAGPLREAGLEVVSSVEEGDPAPVILDAVEGNQDTLVAMCTHGRSGLTRWMVGSITDKVLHATRNPMLVVRVGDSAASVDLDTLIVPLDGSELAEQALDQAVMLAKALGLKVVLVRVTPSAEEYHRYMSATPISAAATVYTGPYEEFAKEADARAMQYLHRITEQLAEQHLITVEQLLLRGHAAEVISGVAEDIPNSLLIMTTHGRSGVGRWLLGSVTDRVVRQSEHPVLVIHPRD